MQLTVDLPFDQLMNLIKHLPANQIAKLKSELDDAFIDSKAKDEKTEFQKFLLMGPVMSDEQYKQFKENRKRFNQWRKN